MSGPAPAVGRGLVRRALRGRVGSTVLPVLVVVAVFAGVLPRITDYSEVWRLVEGLSWAETLLVAALAVLNLGSYAPLWMAAVPGLGLWRALLADQASTAVSNTVPAGFAFGVGTTAVMYHSFGCPAGVISRAVALTGLWNTLVKLAMPVVALGGLALTGQVTRELLVAAVLGAVLLAVAVAAVVLVLTHRGVGAVLAVLAERAAAGVARLLQREPPSGWVARVDRFRTGSLVLLRRRWPHLTAAAVGSHTALFVLLLACLRVVEGPGSAAGWLEVLAVFCITRLVTMVPITPGALGVAELSYVAGLTAVGVAAAPAGAAVLVFRFLTWFLPIPLGAGAWLLWRRSTGVRPGQQAPSVTAGA